MVDDHVAITDLLALWLQTQAGGAFEVVGSAHRGPEGLELCRQLLPDVAVLDLVLPGLGGLDLLRGLLGAVPTVRVLVFTGGANPTLLRAALRLGVRGLVAKTSGGQVFLDALRSVAAGARYLDPALLPHAGRVPEPPLSGPERQVLLHVAAGGSPKEIAASLGLSVEAVEAQRASLLAKLDLHDVAGLSRYAIHTGLVPPP